MIWTPPINFNAPIPPKDYIYRWIRLETIKLKNKRKPGFSFVRLNKIKNKRNYPWIYIKNLGKCVGIEGLALIKIKKERIKKI
jgi:hypothetical protein